MSHLQLRQTLPIYRIHTGATGEKVGKKKDSINDDKAVDIPNSYDSIKSAVGGDAKVKTKTIVRK